MQVLDTQEYVPYRVYNFLEQPGVPQHVKWDKETVYLHWPGQDLPLRYDTGADLYMGFSDADLRQNLSSFSYTRLLHFENLEPHSFSGFTRPKVQFKPTDLRLCSGVHLLRTPQRAVLALRAVRALCYAPVVRFTPRLAAGPAAQAERKPLADVGTTWLA